MPVINVIKKRNVQEDLPELINNTQQKNVTTHGYNKYPAVTMLATNST